MTVDIGEPPFCAVVIRGQPLVIEPQRAERGTEGQKGGLVHFFWSNAQNTAVAQLFFGRPRGRRVNSRPSLAAVAATQVSLP